MSGKKNFLRNTWGKIRVKPIDGPLYSSKGAEVGEKWTDYFSNKDIKEIRAGQKKK